MFEMAIQDSILGRAFEDVEFYSRRSKAGVVHTTVPVYARVAPLVAASPALKGEEHDNHNRSRR